MTITLITGANKGLGFEAARRLIGKGHTVYLGARDPEKGRVAAEALGTRYVVIDVTDEASVDSAAAELQRREGHLDVLINNAGISGGFVPVEDLTVGIVRAVYETNVFGVVRVTRAMLPLLRASTAAVIVNVSSGLGSFGVVTNPERLESQLTPIAYGSSKSAVAMLTLQYAKALPELRINAVDPGYTATDLNQNLGTQTVTEGTEAVVRLALIGADGPTGTLQDANGVMPW